MKLYKVSGKSWRDKRKKQIVTLYHISPDRLTALLPRSKFLESGRTGVFLCPSYKSLILDWAYYVKDKKHNDHPLRTIPPQLYNRVRELEKQMKTNPSPELELEISKINAQLDKINETQKNKAYWESVKGYKSLYIHTIECPIEIYQICKSRMDKAYEDDPVKSMGFWDFGQQVFVDKEFLPQLKVFNVKKFNTSQFLNEFSNLDNKRYMTPSMKMSPQQMEEWEQRGIEKREKEEAAEKRRIEVEEYRKRWDKSIPSTE